MSLTGRAFALVLLGLAPLLIWPSPATVALWCLLVAAIVALDVALAVSPKSLVLQRLRTGQIRLGEPTQTTVLLTNPARRRLRGVVRDAWQPSAGTCGERHLVDLGGGERTRLVTPMRPTRRGDRYADRVTVRSLGPLGVAARQRSAAVPGVVRALPPFTSRKYLPSRLAMLRQLDGRSAVRTRGQGTEFDSLRDYVEGDDVRSIDWRATARRGAVVVRTWQPERDRRIVLVLDTSRTSAGRIGDVPRLDAAMDAALLLAALASRAGDRVLMIAGDRRIRTRVGQSDRTNVLSQLVDAMAPIEPALLEADWSLLAGTVAQTVRRRALVVLLTPLEPAALEEGLLPVLPTLTQRHRVVLASVRDPALGQMVRQRDSTAAVYDAAAAERTTTLRERTADVLRQLGVDVLDADPDTLPVVLADHYLSLKAGGLL